MNVSRISSEGLELILNNRVLKPVTCIIKFYSNGCHLCHALQDYYVDIADKYALDENIVFYAYNVDDDKTIEKRLAFDGVPTIIAVNPNPDAPARIRAKHTVMQEPENPHDKTWYRVKDILQFVERNKIK
jgi:thiol-disulfide isomerase/thioredoxin